MSRRPYKLSMFPLSPAAAERMCRCGHWLNRHDRGADAACIYCECKRFDRAAIAASPDTQEDSRG